MNKVLVLFPILLLCIILTECTPEPAVSSFRFEFVNNSLDTVGYSVYAHIRNSNSDDVFYILSGNFIAPMKSVIGGAQHYGDDDSWSSFFNEKRIDTLYIYMSPKKCQRRKAKNVNCLIMTIYLKFTNIMRRIQI